MGVGWGAAGWGSGGSGAGDTLMSRNARNGENGENGEKSPASGDLNWMPEVAPWRLAILAKMAILVKLAILAKNTSGLNGEK